MLKIDNNLLQELGLGSLPDSEKNSLLKHIYETLEMRVGMRLADQMTNQQLDEFEQYFEAKDDAGAFKWLESNFPNYKDIVQEEFDKLKTEVGQAAPQILAASQAAAVAPAQQQSPSGVPEQQGQPQGQPVYQQQPQTVGYPEPAQFSPQPVQPQQQFAQPGQGYAPQQAPAPAQPYAAPPAPQTGPAPQPFQQAMPGQQVGQQPDYQPPFPNQQPPAGPGAA